ncbi:Protein of unknown function [Alteromonadaceae bacterium Bs31]|nr:Protein of unknown function [Alteromonadaceae bacterium Bs31]
MDREKRFTLDNNTSASNPGEINFSPFVWFLHKPINVSLVFLTLAIALIAAIKVNLWFLLLVALAVGVNSFYWVRVKEHYTADSNPGLILSVQPPLFAVYTDLSKGSGWYPAIKVTAYKSRKPIEPGLALATVATYSDAHGNDCPYWSDFHPLPIEYATNDSISIKRELESYKESNWNNLKNAVSYLHSPYQVGLIPLVVEGSSWPKT